MSALPQGMSHVQERALEKKRESREIKSAMDLTNDGRQRRERERERERERHAGAKNIDKKDRIVCILLPSDFVVYCVCASSVASLEFFWPGHFNWPRRIFLGARKEEEEAKGRGVKVDVCVSMERCCCDNNKGGLARPNQKCQTFSNRRQKEAKGPPNCNLPKAISRLTVTWPEAAGFFSHSNIISVV